MAAGFEKSFIDGRFPAPGEYTTDLDDYYYEITSNEGLDAGIRVKAAYERGTLGGLKAAGRYSAFLQLHAAGELALKRYANIGAHSESQRRR
jgi:hypothetical protein